MIGDRSAPACKKRHLSVSNWSKYLIVFFKIFLFLFCSLGLSSFFFIHINFVLASEERVIFIRLCISQIMDRSALGVVDSMQNENLFSCFWEYLSSRKKKHPKASWDNQHLFVRLFSIFHLSEDLYSTLRFSLCIVEYEMTAIYENYISSKSTYSYFFCLVYAVHSECGKE